jgi:hypothetical protein
MKFIAGTVIKTVSALSTHLLIPQYTYIRKYLPEYDSYIIDRIEIDENEHGKVLLWGVGYAAVSFEHYLGYSTEASYYPREFWLYILKEIFYEGWNNNITIK